jgi:hypothetical protein
MPTDMTAMKDIRFTEQVTFRLPADWIETMEDGLGLFQPARPDSGSLRVTTEVMEAASDLPATTRSLLVQTAERFVRADDPRGHDRMVEEIDDGGIFASFNARTVIDGANVMIYLWLRGRTSWRRVTVALFSYVLPAERDGEVPFVDTVAMLDREIRDARILDPENRRD